MIFNHDEFGNIILEYHEMVTSIIQVSYNRWENLATILIRNNNDISIAIVSNHRISSSKIDAHGYKNIRYNVRR
jgi:hypothetical protein